MFSFTTPPAGSIFLCFCLPRQNPKTQVVSKVSKLHPLPSFPDLLPWRVGRATKEEAECEHGIQVFMTSQSGYTSNEHRRVLLDKDTPLREVRGYFGRELRQSKVADEHGFAFSESDLEQPLWKFSDHCALQVGFVHTYTEDAKQFVEQSAQPSWGSGAADAPADLLADYVPDFGVSQNKKKKNKLV